MKAFDEVNALTRELRDVLVRYNVDSKEHQLFASMALSRALCALLITTGVSEEQAVDCLRASWSYVKDTKDKLP